MAYQGHVVLGTPHDYRPGARSSGTGQPLGLGQMYAGPWRLLRTLGVSATCVSLSVAGHLLGAGSSGPTLSMVCVVGLLSVVLLTLILAAFSGRRWTLARSLVALGLGQVGLHGMFSVMLSSPDHHRSATAGGASMVLAHGVAALLIGLGIAVNDSALDTYFQLASSLVGSGIAVLARWCLAAPLIPILDEVARVAASGRSEWLARWRRPRILTDLVVLHCLSRRGPPALGLAS
jgi:hypothetical protein